jgi:hypothetical protein
LHVWARTFVICLASGVVCAQSSLPAADPFTPSQRIQYYLQRTFSWQRMALLGADTAVDHLLGGKSSLWSDGPFGYASRYGDSFGCRLTRNTMELGLGMALREDVRYKRSQTQGFRRRLRYATTHALLASTPDGRFRPAYSRLAAAFGGEIVSAAWRPRPFSAGELAGSGAWTLLDRFPNSYLDEFTPDLVNFGRRARRKLGGLLRKPAPAGERTLEPLIP